MNPLLDVKNLTVTFATDEGDLTAVRDVSFHMDKGEILGLVGESGCGKSITAMSILRLVPMPPGNIESGSISFKGNDILQLSAKELHQLRGNSISMIFQEPMTALSPLHRVGKQLAEALRFHQKISKTDAWQTAEDWLTKVGIPDAEIRMYAYPFELSGGMRQRVMIAMALMLGPELIIADEPTTALDVTVQAQIFDLMNGMKDNDTSLLLITHDMGVIWEMCDRVIVMYASKIVEEGMVESVFRNPAHPYTKALLDSMPSLTTGKKRLNAIKGQVPSPLNHPPGCNFAERCPSCLSRCRTEEPVFKAIGDGKHVACFLHDS